METTAFFAVLFAALLHASWNAIIRTSGNRFQGMLILTTAQGSMGVVMAPFFALPSGEVWFWLIASGLLHTGYKLFLAAAYKHGDLSRVYPIARGVAPMIVVLAGLVILNDDLSNREYVGVGLIGIGIIMMAQGVFRNGEARVLIPLALGSALCTAGYSIVDGLGARVAGDASLFIAWILLFDMLFFTSATLVTVGPRFYRASAKVWAIGSIAGALSLATYWIVVWAMTIAPIALVTALRETSVLFAVLIGVLLMKEKADRGKILAAVVVVIGVIVIRI